jgi:hypothetical protein
MINVGNLSRAQKIFICTVAGDMLTGYNILKATRMAMLK